MAAEKDFENRVKRWLSSVGIYSAGTAKDRMTVPAVGWFTKIWGGGYQKAGIPDILCCVRGKFLAIEVKAENGSPSQLQILNADRIRDSGGDAVILYPSGFEDFKEDVEFLIEHVSGSILFRKTYK